MAVWLRKVRKSKWYKSDAVTWLEVGELQADAFSDLSTKSNTLSWWLIKDDRSNLERVLAALASKSDHLSVIDFALLNDEVIHDVGIEIQEVEGDTADSEANALWHRDFVHLTTEKILRLADEISLPGRIDRCNDKKVRSFVKNSVDAGQIDLARVKDAIRRKVQA